VDSLVTIALLTACLAQPPFSPWVYSATVIIIIKIVRFFFFVLFIDKDVLLFKKWMSHAATKRASPARQKN
jgi:hypothetical protein